MQADELAAIPEAALNRLDPVRMQEYAQSTGWVLEPRLGKGKLAVFQRPDSRLKQVRIPLTRELVDYPTLITQAIVGLAEWVEKPAPELLSILLLPPADILRFNESGTAVESGDVPLDHGISVIGGIRKTLLAAACSVIRPGQSFHRRMSLAEAEQFLSKCRLEQTERGSFIITIACPLDAIPLSASLFDETPFTRNVTDFFMRSLHRLMELLEAPDAVNILEAGQGEPVLSANLCEGLLDMTPEGDDAVLTIAASWAQSLPSRIAQPAHSSVRIKRDMFPKIEYLAGRLRLTVSAT